MPSPNILSLVFEMEGNSKAFSNVLALGEMRLAGTCGEGHSVVGENGAGVGSCLPRSC
jgi:ABC-type sugar transport system ATPase subunit